MSEIRLTPQDIIFSAFRIHQTKSLDVETLVAFALAGNCPNRVTALGVLRNMVKDKQLVKDSQLGIDIYSLKTARRK